MWLIINSVAFPPSVLGSGAGGDYFVGQPLAVFDHGNGNTKSNTLQRNLKVVPCSTGVGASDEIDLLAWSFDGRSDSSVCLSSPKL